MDINYKSQKEVKRIRVFSDDEIKRIKEVIYSTNENGKRKYPYGDAYLFILNTGLRAGEALALDRNIDFDCPQIEIIKNLITTKNRNNDGRIIKNKKGYVKTTAISNTPKTKKSHRFIKLNAKAIEYAQNLLKLPSNCNNLIVNKDGNILTIQALARTFSRILSDAGINSSDCQGIHSLRHTFATKLFEAGVDVKVVSTILGHSSTTVTYNTYIHILDEIKARAMDIPNF